MAHARVPELPTLSWWFLGPLFGLDAFEKTNPFGAVRHLARRNRKLLFEKTMPICELPSWSKLTIPEASRLAMLLTSLEKMAVTAIMDVQLTDEGPRIVPVEPERY